MFYLVMRNALMSIEQLYAESIIPSRRVPFRSPYPSISGRVNYLTMYERGGQVGNF